MSRTSTALSWGCLGCALACAGCAPAPSETFDQGFGDAGPVVVIAQSEMIASSASYDAIRPAPAIQPVRAVAPSGSPCRLDHPPGDCDRCPDRACRQVYVRGAASEGEWVAFCDQGRVSEEARIACLCAGGGQISCAQASLQTAGALALLTHVFSGRVPPVGTRYRDEYGLRDHVDQEMHDWLAAVSSAPTTFRCDAPDREAAEARYVERSLRVRLTGQCEE